MAQSEAFRNANIQGVYALTSLAEGGRTPGASIGMLWFNGHGNVSGQIITNMPGQTYQERRVEQGSVEGTYTIDEAGSGFGRAETVYRYGDGTVLATAARFMINQVDASITEARAQSLTVMQEGLDLATGGLVTASLTRLPDEGVFTSKACVALTPESVSPTAVSLLSPAPGLSRLTVRAGPTHPTSRISRGRASASAFSSRSTLRQGNIWLGKTASAPLPPHKSMGSEPSPIW